MMKRAKIQCALSVAFLVLLLNVNCSGFQVPSRRQPGTRLWGRSRRGKLAENISPGEKVPSSRSKKKRSSSPPSKSSSTGGISPSLAEWASENAEENTTDESVLDVRDIDEESPVAEDTAPRYVTFENPKSRKKSKSQRRSKQSARKAEDQERDELIGSAIATLENLVEEKPGASFDEILNAARELVKIKGGNLRTLTAGARSHDYRLAWVGSDDAVCHIGTGLHKVPLARLQEVFMTLKGRSRIELLEVIRVLGPFPNVRNTLQGNSSVELGDPAASWSITMDSMVDGAGKEILAGKEDNIRKVNLQVYFADEKAIVAVVPPSSGLRQNIFEDNGAHILVFVREDELEAKLDGLRVS